MGQVYEISTGRYRHGAKILGTGYAGYDDGDGIPEPGEGKNDPTKQAVRAVGPIPVGRYRIHRPFKHPTAGPFTMRLEPLPGTDTKGRAGFLIHGDRSDLPGAASHGCIILPRAVREAIWALCLAGDDVVEVVEGPTLAAA